MSHLLFNTATIRVPPEQNFINKSGNVNIVPTLTKKNAISKRLGTSSIIIKKDNNILYPVIEDKGLIENIEDIKQRQKKLKTIKKKLETLPPKPKINKEGIKYALSKLPKKKKGGFLSDWLEIKNSASTDIRSTKTKAKILDEIFNKLNELYTKEDIKDYEKTLEIPYSVYDNIFKWARNKEGKIEYTDFVRKVIYPALLKTVSKDKQDKLKLMFLANDIAHDGAIIKDYEDDINKYTVTRTFITKELHQH